MFIPALSIIEYHKSRVAACTVHHRIPQVTRGCLHCPSSNTTSHALLPALRIIEYHKSRIASCTAHHRIPQATHCFLHCPSSNTTSHALLPALPIIEYHKPNVACLACDMLTWPCNNSTYLYMKYILTLHVCTLLPCYRYLHTAATRCQSQTCTGLYTGWRRI